MNPHDQISTPLGFAEFAAEWFGVFVPPALAAGFAIDASEHSRRWETATGPVCLALDPDDARHDAPKRALPAVMVVRRAVVRVVWVPQRACDPFTVPRKLLFWRQRRLPRFLLLLLFLRSLNHIRIRRLFSRDDQRRHPPRSLLRPQRRRRQKRRRRRQWRRRIIGVVRRPPFPS